MFAKKQLPASSAPKTYRKELELLYARRSAIDTLIESLEEYARFGSVNKDGGEQTA
jgi:hypothetical protein